MQPAVTAGARPALRSAQGLVGGRAEGPSSPLRPQKPFHPPHLQGPQPAPCNGPGRVRAHLTDKEPRPPESLTPGWPHGDRQAGLGDKMSPGLPAAAGARGQAGRSPALSSHSIEPDRPRWSSQGKQRFPTSPPLARGRREFQGKPGTLPAGSEVQLPKRSWPPLTPFSHQDLVLPVSPRCTPPRIGGTPVGAALGEMKGQKQNEDQCPYKTQIQVT